MIIYEYWSSEMTECANLIANLIVSNVSESK